MNLLRSLRRLDDVVLARLGFTPDPITVDLGEQIIGPEEMTRLVARHLARANL